nr:uncharacterized protein LOC128706520 [Cherax quadricarinatus]
MDEMDEDENTLEVSSMITHDGGHSIDHTTLQNEVHYVTTDESGHSVTVVYPQSALPMIRTPDGSLVNFVDLPGVHGELGLDQGELTGETGMVLQQDFPGEGPITVVTADDTGEQLALLDQEHGHSTVTMTSGEGAQAITYLTAAEDTGDGSASALLGEQLIQIPASDQSGSAHTITLPLSFLNDSAGVSILQGLSHLQLPLVGETGGDSITLTSPVDSDNIASVSGADVTHSQVLSVLQSSTIPTTASGTFNVMTSQSSIHSDHNRLPTTQHLHVPNATSRSHHSLSTKSVVLKTTSPLSGKQNSSQQPRKFLGTGPLAISAQGVVQRIGNRMVTVLPRPEDLKKLKESKSLIVSVKGSGDSDLYGSKSPRTRKIPVPVRPHQRYGRRGRGVGRGRPSSVSRIDDREDNDQIAKTISLLKKEAPGDSILLAETSGDHHLDGCIKLEDSGSEGIVVDMTLPGGSPASAVLVKGPPEDEEYILPDLDPTLPVTSRRGRRKKRGRGRPRGTYVISSTGRRPGRPKKVETLLEGPHGARMIHTGPDTRLDGQHEDQENDLSENVPTIELAGVEGSDGLQELRVLEMGNLKQEPLDFELKKEEEVDPNKRKLPPRRRGLRYEKMIQALKKRENDDDDFSMGEEDDFSPDYLTHRRPPPAPRTRGASGPGKRGRPRKDRPPPTEIKMEPDTRHHILGGTIDDTHISEAGAGDLVTSVTEGDLTDADKHNLLITFQRPETGEMVITMLPPPPTTQHHNELHDHTTTEGTQTEEDIDLPADDACVNGHRCEECGEIIQFKRDYIRHLRQKHNLRPFECDQCGKTCTSHIALEAHHKVHGLERPHRCDYCGKGFVDPSHLKTHILTHTGERPHSCQHCFKAFAQASQLKKHLAIHEESFQYKCSVCYRNFAHRDTLYTHMKTHTSDRPFICDICTLSFVTSSGLNRHRKVHKRSSDPVGGLEDELKCSVCQANFTYKRTLTKHMSTVHDDGLIVKEEDEGAVKPFSDEFPLLNSFRNSSMKVMHQKLLNCMMNLSSQKLLRANFPQIHSSVVYVKSHSQMLMCYVITTPILTLVIRKCTVMYVV